MYRWLLTSKCKLLQLKIRVSQDAKFEFRSNPVCIDHYVDEHIHICQ
jgi:hypothetical protein